MPMVSRCLVYQCRSYLLFSAHIGDAQPILGWYTSVVRSFYSQLSSYWGRRDRHIIRCLECTCFCSPSDSAASGAERPGIRNCPVQGSGFRVCCLGLVFQVQGLGFRRSRKIRTRAVVQICKSRHKWAAVMRHLSRYRR